MKMGFLEKMCGVA